MNTAKNLKHRATNHKRVSRSKVVSLVSHNLKRKAKTLLKELRDVP